MKKRVKIFLLAAVLLAAPLAGVAFGHFTQQYSFDEIWVRTWSTLPAEADRELCIVYPGPTWDDPDPPASQSQSYHGVMNLLRSRRYRKSLLPSPMEDGGTLIYLHEGCIPSTVAYWSDGKLWLADENEAWTAYVPNDAGQFKEQMEAFLKRYKY